MADPQDANEDVKNLLLGTIPERADDVAALIEKTSYRRAYDRPAMHLEATAFGGHGLVILTDRTMQQVWLIAYLSWRALVEQSGYVVGFRMQNLPYDLNQVEREGRLDQVVADVDRLGEALEELRRAEEGAIPWPSDVPRLTPDLSELRDVQDKAAYDLGCFACAFLLLHETCHALKRADGEEFGQYEEELECDQYAIDLLLNGCNDYADSKGYNRLAIRSKRAIGVFLGMTVVLESTELGLWLDSSTHPPLTDRIELVLVAVNQLDLDEDDNFWIYASSVLLSKLRRDDRLPPPITYQSFKELFQKIFNCLAIDVQSRQRES